jgi:hypothetical protein
LYLGDGNLINPCRRMKITPANKASFSCVRFWDKRILLIAPPSDSKTGSWRFFERFGMSQSLLYHPRQSTVHVRHCKKFVFRGNVFINQEVMFMFISKNIEGLI